MKRLVIVPLCCLLLSACNFFGPPTKTVAEFNAYVAANPNGLDGKTLSGVQLDGAMTRIDDNDVPAGEDKYAYAMSQGGVGGIVIQNMKVTGLTVDKSSLLFASIRNVTFVDCKFLQTDMTGSTLENVKFVNCEFDGIEPGRKIGNIYHRGRVTNLNMVAADNVVFENVAFGKGFSSNFHRGVITLINVKASPSESPIIRGINVKLRLLACTLHDRNIAAIKGDDSSILILNSDIKGLSCSSSITKVVWIEKTLFYGGAGTSEFLMIRDSAGTFEFGGYYASSPTAYLVNNQYNDTGYSTFFPSIKKGNSATLYLYGSNNYFPMLRIGSGNINIFNVNFGILNILEYGDIGVKSLNLKNVSIKEGKWLAPLPETGYWEQVEIIGPVELAQQSKAEISGYNVLFPNGSPWINGDVEIKHLSSPQKMQMPPVPTLEEVGLAQFWQEVDAKSSRQ